MILDTTFLIDLERELRRGVDGPACAVLLSSPPTAPLFVTETILGELAAGSSLADREKWEKFVAPYRMLEGGRETAWQYGCVFRALDQRGQRIGSNDLWIAAAALAHNLPVLTRNAEEVRRGPGLAVVGG